MSLTMNKKVKATRMKLYGNCLQIRFETIFERRFEIEMEAGDSKTLGNEIKEIAFKNCSMIDFPLAECLLKLAPNLTSFVIHNSKLSRISSSNLRGFGCLVELNLGYNDIEELPGDLFGNTPNLQDISLSNNKIKVIGENILDPLKNLKIFNLSNNPGIDITYNREYEGRFGYPTLADFKEAIKRCKSVQDVWIIVDEQKKDHQKQLDDLKKVCDELAKKLEEVKRTGTFQKSDFTIKINGKEFKTQKEILIANSPFLANLIRDDEGADTLELKDISEEAFEEILNFMVNKSQPKPTANFIELYAASGRLQMKELMDMSARVLMNKVNEENAPEILILCKNYPNIELQKKAYAEYGKALEK